MNVPSLKRKIKDLRKLRDMLMAENEQLKADKAKKPPAKTKRK